MRVNPPESDTVRKRPYEHGPLIVTPRASRRTGLRENIGAFSLIGALACVISVPVVGVFISWGWIVVPCLVGLVFNIGLLSVWEEPNDGMGYPC